MRFLKPGKIPGFKSLPTLLLIWLLISMAAGHETVRATEPPGLRVAYLPLVLRTPGPIYWGTLVGASGTVLAPSAANMQPGGPYDTFEQRARKKMAILHWGQPWIMNGLFQNFPTSYFDNVRNHGSLPLLDWSSWALGGGAVQPGFRLSTITASAYDAYIQQWARDAGQWGHPFFLRFDWEMNGNWQFPWSEQLNGNQAGDYLRAWRHVHDLFAQAGASNVTWVWCPNISGSTTLPMASLYPGDSYVDWTCLDGYNKYDAWLGFNTVFTGSGITWLYNSYQEILAVAPAKPIMIGETASVEAGDGGAKKARWITDTFLTQLPQNFPQVKAIVWFNNSPSPQETFQIESSQLSTDAFASAIGSDYYAANDFASAEGSPIRPLP